MLFTYNYRSTRKKTAANSYCASAPRQVSKEDSSTLHLEKHPQANSSALHLEKSSKTKNSSSGTAPGAENQPANSSGGRTSREIQRLNAFHVSQSPKPRAKEAVSVRRGQG